MSGQSTSGGAGATGGAGAGGGPFSPLRGGVPPGVPSGPPPAVPAGPFPALPPTSGLAVASLVLGIFSLCTLGLTAIPGLIVGIVGLGRVRRSGGRLAGRGVALAGIIVSLVGLFFLLVCVLGVLVTMCFWESAVSFEPFEVPGTPRARAAEAMVKMSLLAQVAREYAEEHGGRLPTREEYPDGLAKHLDHPPREAVKLSGGRRIALNAAVAGLPLAAVESPDRTVLVFEAEAGAPLVSGPERLRAVDGPGEGYVIGFVSGRVAWVDEEDLDDLIWEPSGGMIRL